MESDQMLFATFNQDRSCFAIGTEKGFRICNAYPFKDSFHRDLEGGIGIIEMLNRCNILALVGGGKNPKFHPNKVILWDDAQTKVISELRFTTYVKNIKLKQSKIFVVCEQKIYVFNFEGFKNVDTIETYQNNKGIIGVCQDGKINIIAYPDLKKGTVTIKNYDNKDMPKVTIEAHNSEIGCISMNNDGSLIATASEKGTLIRIFKADGTPLQELRRGTEKAEIYSIAFDDKSKFIACSSDRGTIHIFSIKKDDAGDTQNSKSLFGKIGNFLGVKNEYLNSEWSFAQFRIPDMKSICAFSQDGNILAITSDGKYYQANFDHKNGGECTKILEKNFMAEDNN